MSPTSSVDGGEDLVFDIETDGLLDDGPKGPGLTKIHCIGLINIETGEEALYPPERLKEGLDRLSKARRLIGHNIVTYDIKAIKKIYPEWVHPKTIPFDTLVAAKLVWPGDRLWDIDSKLVAKGLLPGNLRKRYSLKAFGYRLGFHKGNFAQDQKDEGVEDVWANYTPEMGDYCLQDCRVQLALYRKILEKTEGTPQSVFDLEMEVADICHEQERYGFYFDIDRALKLLAELQNRQAELEEKLIAFFPPWFSPVWDVRKDSNGEVMKDAKGRALVAPKVEVIKASRNVKLIGHHDVTIPRIGKNGKPLKPYVGPPIAEYTEGDKFCPVRYTDFNPSSREHIADRLETLYGWKPVEYTKDGQAKLDETILKALPYEPCGLLVEYFITTKIVGMLAQGSQSWISNYNEKTHRIHGRIDPLGTITGRASHSNPNMGQIPSVQLGPDKHHLVGVEGGYGYESRSLFTVPPGWDLVGADASGLELRCLSHYMAPFDGGEYADIVVNGDVHTINQKAAGLLTRASAKTMIYAFLYGAGDLKLGTIIMEDRKEAGWSEKKLRSEGKKLKEALLTNLPALGTLVDRVKKRGASGTLKGLDGRTLYVRSAHAALNTLLQSAGAIICKKWLVITRDYLDADGLVFGVDRGQSAWVHDEVQVACRPGLWINEKKKIHRVGEAAVQAIKDTAKVFNFRCELSGEYKVGRNWAETH